jgi:hypothetical protein
MPQASLIKHVLVLKASASLVLTKPGANSQASTSMSSLPQMNMVIWSITLVEKRQMRTLGPIF